MEAFEESLEAGVSAAVVGHHGSGEDGEPGPECGFVGEGAGFADVFDGAEKGELEEVVEVVLRAKPEGAEVGPDAVVVLVIELSPGRFLACVQAGEKGPMFLPGLPAEGDRVIGGHGMEGELGHGGRLFFESFEFCF